MTTDNRPPDGPDAGFGASHRGDGMSHHEAAGRPVRKRGRLALTLRALRRLMVSPVEQTRMESSEPIRILIVEDEQVSRRALGLLLENCGYRVQLAESAEEALQLLQQRLRPDVILLDIDLPGMSGLELLSLLNTTAPDVVPLLLTSWDQEHVLNAVDRGVGYIRKPIDIKELLSALGNSTDGR
jgi:two-component system, OmpR family, sensor histidine kinase TorS